MGLKESIGGVESVTTFADDSVSAAAVFTEGPALATCFPLADFSALGMIFTLGDFSSLVELRLIT